MVRFRSACFLILMSLFCCKKPYNPPATSTANSYLVVEGVINPGSDSTIIKLSKTVTLNAAVTLNPLVGATVIVEDSQNNTWPLIGDGNGNYISTGLNLPVSKLYRLRISTGSGSQYLSDFENVKITPPIDSIGYVVQNDGLQVYVNSHDPSNSTHYYRWDYDETWIFHAKYLSVSKLDTISHTIEYRTPDQMVYFCFGNQKSSNIILNSTTKLSRDVVYQSPLIKIPLTSEKLESKYSILVKQYALTAKAYAFYQNLKKNTEQLGSVFDAQPSQLVGNIHCTTNSNEPVVGYITVASIQSKRIFIANSSLPKGIAATYPYDCKEDTAYYINKQGFNDVQNTLINPPYSYEATTPISAPGAGIIAFKYSTPICMDCTLRGTTKVPSFWK
ncbi:DUF4249 domain-containing protein [Mucilaginibacter sp.]|uniref:DUF4249 domain-containing protein n=1 Tax=Mucilaginibacter sp. TaxID=1882438 RepID=UPI00284A81DB|nr:DUF4249 domain-containing protein [Mucilaginibacter sp.]MDR3697469.1 DUF4249 domain-containing protein [Mucilaginibacter sp.]